MIRKLTETQTQWGGRRRRPPHWGAAEGGACVSVNFLIILYTGGGPPGNSPILFSDFLVVVGSRFLIKTTLCPPKFSRGRQI